jgi:hypothetical protein
MKVVRLTVPNDDVARKMRMPCQAIQIDDVEAEVGRSDVLASDEASPAVRRYGFAGKYDGSTQRICQLRRFRIRRHAVDVRRLRRRMQRQAYRLPQAVKP